MIWLYSWKKLRKLAFVSVIKTTELFNFKPNWTDWVLWLIRQVIFSKEYNLTKLDYLWTSPISFQATNLLPRLDAKKVCLEEIIRFWVNWADSVEASIDWGSCRGKNWRFFVKKSLFFLIYWIKENRLGFKYLYESRSKNV